MNKALFIISTILTVSIGSTKATTTLQSSTTKIQTAQDSTRLAELDQYWDQLAKTVIEGDYEGYGALYHEDAVVVFTGGENKTSVPIAKALAGWKQGFLDTKAGKRHDKVEFRMSQRIGDETTAHETGLFLFTSMDRDGNILSKGVTHLEMLLVKKGNEWLAVMEYQKSKGTMEEWEALGG